MNTKLTITLIIGLPASGKSYYAKNKFEKIVDDPIHINEIYGFTTNFCIVDQNFCNSEILNKAIKLIKNNYEFCEIKKNIF